MTDPTAASDIEAMIQATGGVPVVIGSVSTHGHLGRLDPGVWDLSEAGGAKAVATVAAGVLAGDPAVGDAVTVDGEALVVLDHREVDDGALVSLAVGLWSHTVDIHRPSTAGEPTSGQQQTTYPEVATGVECDIWAQDGEIRSRQMTREAVGDWQARFPPGTDVQPDDLLEVTAGEGPDQLRVLFVGDRTDRWRIPADLEESGEDLAA